MDKHQVIQDKWQKKWEKNKTFEAEIDEGKEKFFITVPYPYISGSLHIGHARVVTEADVLARFYRMKGKNVLFPLSFHISGTPVLGISLAIKNKNQKKIALYKKYVETYVSNKKEVTKIVNSFEDPQKIVEFFAPKMIEEFSTLGLSVDWRRSFTSGDIEHQKLVEWQFTKYKEKNYLVQGKHPVLYSLSLENAVGEDDITDGDINPVEKQEFTIIKFKFEDGFIIAATLRPETMYGQTNMWVNPSIEYVKAKVGSEIWYVSKECASKLSYQDRKVEILETVKGENFIGKMCFAPIVNREIMILPSTHCNPKIGTGLVTSVPSDAPFDYVALKELQEDLRMCKKYSLDIKRIKNIVLIPIIQSKGYTDFPAIDATKKYGIKSLKQKKELEIATQEVYKSGFHTGVMLETCGKFKGMLVTKAKEEMKKELIETGCAESFWEVSREAVSRDGGEIIVAILDNQWFLDFNAKGWKTKAKKCLDKMEILPNKYRKQFNDVFDWLDKRPCARRRGLGTKLPYDKKWVIESLSDSTIYMSLYTIQNLLKKYKIKGESLAPEFFDFVFRGEGDETGLSKKLKIKVEELEELRKSFDYWYPNDHRHTFTAHLSNHLSFMIFAHVACFPEKKWNKKISFHGMVISEGVKMSKSKGNTVTIVELNEKYGADAFRAFLCNSTSVESTMNWQSEEVLKTKNHLKNVQNVLVNMADNRGEGEVEDKALVSKIEKLVKRANISLENMDLRDYSNIVLYDILRLYNKAERENPEIEVVNNYLFDRWVRLLTPLVPHLAEECNAIGGSKSFVSEANWPLFDKSKVNDKAEFVQDCVEELVLDIEEIKKLVGINKVNEVKVIISPEWKYKFVDDFKKKFAKEKNVGGLIKALATKENGKQIAKLVPFFIKHPAKIPRVVLSQSEELQLLQSKKSLIEAKFNCTLVLEVAERSSELKAKNAMPAKPAILVK